MWILIGLELLESWKVFWGWKCEFAVVLAEKKHVEAANSGHGFRV